MILVWSSEGGPLQLIGLGIFVLQFIVPQLIDGPFFSIESGQNGFSVTGGLPLLWAILSVAVALMMFVGWFLWRDGEGNNHGATTGDGTASNPVDVDAETEVNNSNNVDRASTSAWDAFRSFIRNLSPHYLMLASAFILPLSMAFPILLNAGGAGIMGSSTGTIAVTILAIGAHACMAIAAYGVLREVLSGTAPYPGTRQGRRTRRRKYTVGEIADIVRKVPVEEFVSEEDIKNGECSIIRMKRILKNRGAAEAVERCLEREDLVNEILRVRKYDEACAICSEDYVEG
eukprot:CCRYP_008856-RA/>CCRYP_008856-RA protein AED:0.41 eAED:0.41 QI:0/-1/0/1/-1/1/1/0/287